MLKKQEIFKWKNCKNHHSFSSIAPFYIEDVPKENSDINCVVTNYNTFFYLIKVIVYQSYFCDNL